MTLADEDMLRGLDQLEDNPDAIREVTYLDLEECSDESIPYSNGDYLDEE